MSEDNKDNIQSIEPVVNEITDVSIDPSAFEDECDKECFPAKATKNPTLTTPLVYNDPGAAVVAKKIDVFTVEFLDSFSNPQHAFHKTMTPSVKEKFIDMISNHAALRHKLGFVKQKYYHPMIREPGDVVATVGVASKKGYCASINVYE